VKASGGELSAVSDLPSAFGYKRARRRKGFGTGSPFHGAWKQAGRTFYGDKRARRDGDGEWRTGERPQAGTLAPPAKWVPICRFGAGVLTFWLFRASFTRGQ